MKIFRQCLLLPIRAYKYMLSPLMPMACRFTPSCSDYAHEAIEKFGALHGGKMAVARILRCHPFAKGGFDPVKKEHHHGL